MTYDDHEDLIRRVLLRDTNIPTEEIDNPVVSSPTRSASQNMALPAACSNAKAILLALATVGLVIVPKETTKAQVEAAHGVWQKHQDEARAQGCQGGDLPWMNWESDYYRAMVAAASS